MGGNLVMGRGGILLVERGVVGPQRVQRTVREEQAWRSTHAALGAELRVVRVARIRGTVRGLGQRRVGQSAIGACRDEKSGLVAGDSARRAIPTRAEYPASLVDGDRRQEPAVECRRVADPDGEG